MPIIRIDEEVMSVLKKKGKELGLVFVTPNIVLRIILGLPEKVK